MIYWLVWLAFVTAIEAITISMLMSSLRKARIERDYYKKCDLDSRLGAESLREKLIELERETGDG